MRTGEMQSIGGLVAAAAIVLSPKFTRAQDMPQRQGPFGRGADSGVNRFMAFDRNHDGKLTKSEVTDQRLKALFDRADANHDGTLTKAEMTAEFSRQPVMLGPGGPGGFDGPGGFGGRGFGGPGGPGGPGFGGPPRPGRILPDFVQDRLGLSARQKDELAKLQSDVDRKLNAILTEDQRKQLASQPRRGPGGPGFGGPGFGGPGFGGPPGQGFGRQS